MEVLLSLFFFLEWIYGYVPRYYVPSTQLATTQLLKCKSLNPLSITQEQYKFVYDTLEEHVVCGVSWFPVSELSQRLKQKSQRDPVSKLNEYQKEYQQICKQTPRFTIGDCAGGHRGDNREKNRDVLVVPRKYCVTRK